MPFTSSHIAYLYYRMKAVELNADEQREWELFLMEEPEVSKLLLLMDEDTLVSLFEARRTKTVQERSEKMLREIKEELGFDTAAKHTVPVHRVHFLKTAWFRVAVAVLIIAGIGAYLWNDNQPNTGSSAAIVAKADKNDVMPGSEKAILILSDGRKVELNSAAAETINDRGLDIKNEGGGLLYQNSGVAAINTMTTPKGGQYQLTLSDGTRAWLNAASSITYPTSFTGNTREVSITGEAYFEVKPDKTKPFIVKTSTDEIVVVGTSFNVNNYADEPSSKISLIDGSIKISGKILRPGEAFNNGKIISTNVQQDIAWKNGLFTFENAEIRQVMRQFARWYDIEVKYEGQISKGSITGEMRRSLTLNQAMTTIKRLGYNSRLEGRSLIISQ